MSDLTSNSIDSLNTSNTYDNSSASKALESTLSSTDLSTASDDELLSVCKDFETYFTEQVFKAMQKMVPTDDEDSTSTSSNSLTDYYKDQMVTQYASSASESNGGNGFGIAQMLYEQMKRNNGTAE